MAIDRFEGPFAFLSNFFPAPVFGYPTVEHAYQASKTLDKEERGKIRAAATAAIAKRLGKTVTLRGGWEELKLPYMEVLVREKFTRHPELGKRLLATGKEELVEGNWWGDTFWGVSQGKGENHLGKILMQIRAELEGQ